MSKARGIAILSGAAAVLAASAASMLSDCDVEPALQITVDHAVRGGRLESVPLVVDPGSFRVRASSAERVEVANVAPRTSYTVRVEGDFLFEPGSATTDDRGRGNAWVKAIPLEHDPEDGPAGGAAREKWAELDIRDPNAYVFAWHTPSGVLDRRELPLDAAARFRAIRARWLENGVHKDAADKKLDLAIVRVAGDTPVERIARVLEHLQILTRPIAVDGGEEDRAVFDTSVRLVPATPRR